MPIDPSIPGRVGVGVTPLNDPMQTLAQFSELANRRRLTDVAEQERLQKIRAGEQAEADQQQTAEAYRAAWKQGPDGSYELDVDALMKSVPAAGIPGVLQHAQAATQAAAQRRTAQQAAKKAEATMIANAGTALAAAKYDPALWQFTLQGLRDAELLEPEAYDRLKGITDPAQIERITKTYMQQAGIKPAEPVRGVVVGTGQRVVDPVSGRVIVEGQPAAPTPPAGFTLGPGQVRFGPNGERIATGPPPRPVGGGGGSEQNDVKAIVDGMIAGTLPPQLPGRASPAYNAIMAEAQRRGFDLSGAVTDWTATQKHIQTMNGAQQLRLNQAVNALPEMLDSVETLAQQWKGGRFPVLNRANLKLAKGGAYGAEAAKIANALDAQIADVVADLGNVYMGGNSPTDHALSLAGKSLSADWSGDVLLRMVALAKQNVQIRRNSINSTGVQGASAENPYAPPAAQAPAGPPAAVPAGGRGAPAGGTPYEQYLRRRGGK